MHFPALFRQFSHTSKRKIKNTEIAFKNYTLAAFENFFQHIILHALMTCFFVFFLFLLK